MTVSTVFFDIDGTLVDSNYLHIEAWAHAFSGEGLDVEAWRIHRAIGMDSKKLLEELVGNEDEDRVAAAKEAHSSYYEQLIPRLRAFDGARELVHELAGRGIRVVLATSAPENELKALRAVLEVEDDLAAVTSAEDVETAKPDPDIVKVALEKAGSEPGETVMVGDTVWDVEAAGRAGVACIGVLSGGIGRGELVDAGAAAVYENVAELLRNIDSSPIATI
jgi:HAD superfamily hydrolase (TIGR01509 family)